MKDNGYQGDFEDILISIYTFENGWKNGISNLLIKMPNDALGHQHLTMAIACCDKTY